MRINFPQNRAEKSRTYTGDPSILHPWAYIHTQKFSDYDFSEFRHFPLEIAGIQVNANVFLAMFPSASLHHVLAVSAQCTLRIPAVLQRLGWFWGGFVCCRVFVCQKCVFAGRRWVFGLFCVSVVVCGLRFLSFIEVLSVLT